tara:strand:- start:369 stop:617 length:249 start_codon:yes stop_codon:yes gene_type:complete
MSHSNVDTLFGLPEDVAEHYDAGTAILVRIDSRLAGGSYVHTYAPIGINEQGREVIDLSGKFEDIWQEVQTLRSIQKLFWSE